MGRRAGVTRSADVDEVDSLLAPEVFIRLVEHLRDGVAVLDGSLRVLHVNPAGCALVGYPGEELVGRSALLPVSPDAVESTRADLLGSLHGCTGSRSTRITRPGGQQRDIEYSDTLLETDRGPLLAVIFRDVTDERRALRRQATLAEVAARVAYAQSLENTLTALADCLVESSDMIAYAAIVLDGEPPGFRVVGGAGLPADYAVRFQTALANSRDDLPSVHAFRRGVTVVLDRIRHDRPPAVLERLDGDLEWASIACFPMLTRGRAVGVIKTFWLGPPPAGEELGFLAAVADQAAVAVDNARLLSESADSARRDEVLVAAALALASELSLPAVLSKIVELACEVTEARYGAVGALGPDGRLEDFITHGISAS